MLFVLTFNFYGFSCLCQYIQSDMNLSNPLTFGFPGHLSLIVGASTSCFGSNNRLSKTALSRAVCWAPSTTLSYLGLTVITHLYEQRNKSLEFQNSESPSVRSIQQVAELRFEPRLLKLPIYFTVYFYICFTLLRRLAALNLAPPREPVWWKQGNCFSHPAHSSSCVEVTRLNPYRWQRWNSTVAWPAFMPCVCCFSKVKPIFSNLFFHIFRW